MIPISTAYPHLTPAERSADARTLRRALEEARAEVEQDTQKAWQRLVAECPFQATEDGTCTNENNLTPECTVWACPATLTELCGQAIDEECARCEVEGLRRKVAGECVMFLEQNADGPGGEQITPLTDNHEQRIEYRRQLLMNAAAAIRDRFGVKAK